MSCCNFCCRNRSHGSRRTGSPSRIFLPSLSSCSASLSLSRTHTSSVRRFHLRFSGCTYHGRNRCSILHHIHNVGSNSWFLTRNSLTCHLNGRRNCLTSSGHYQTGSYKPWSNSRRRPSLRWSSENRHLRRWSHGPSWPRPKRRPNPQRRPTSRKRCGYRYSRRRLCL